MDGFAQWLPPYDRFPLVSPLDARGMITTVEASKRFKPAQVMYSNGDVKVDDDHCRCQIASYFNGSAIYELFSERLRRSLANVNRRFQFKLHEDPTKRLRGINILRYDAASGGEFKLHTDLGGHPGVDERKLTLVTLLNPPTEYEGGELHVHNGQLLNAQAGQEIGTTIVFPSFSMHAVTPVTKGVRYVAVTWLHGPHFQ